MASSRLSPAQFKALDSASGSGAVSAHRRTLHALEDSGLIQALRGWVEVPASRYHRRARATERAWGVIGYKITDSGRMALSLEKYRQRSK